MDLNSFVAALGKYSDVENLDLLEKDVRIHLLLNSLASDGTLSSNLVFKGGTCLVKCYLGYWRFSEDLDFTWYNQNRWTDLGTKAARRELRPVQRDLIPRIRDLAGQLDMELEDEPLYGASNQMMTLPLTYTATSNLPAFVKIQINFVEPLLYPVEECTAESLLKGEVPSETVFLQEELSDLYATPIQILAYDPREILVEKCRAILTRQAPKARDILDLYLLDRIMNLNVTDYTDPILAKTKFSLARRERYLLHLKKFPERAEFLAQRGIEHLALKEVNRPEFESFRGQVLKVLAELAQESLKIALS